MAGYGVFNPEDLAHKQDGPKKPTRAMPGRGTLDGIKKDIQAAKAAGEEYDPRGTGAAWTHNFLNKKPWHPLTFRNMAKVWEKEHDHYEKEKKLAESKAEFEAEQAYLKTLSLLSPEEQEKYKQRQSVSFLYMKPPGYDAALERAERAQASGQAVGPGGEALPAAGAGAQGGGGQQQQQQQPGQQQGQGRPQVGPGGHLKNVLGGIKAVHMQQQQQQQRCQLKHAPGMRSPPRGGGSLEASNQQFVVGEMDSEEEEEAMRLAAMPPEERRRMAKEAQRVRREKEQAAAAAQLDQAKAFLRAAGLALPSDDERGGAGSDDSSSSGSGSSGSEEDRHGRRHKRRRHGHAAQQRVGSREREKKHKKERRGRKERKERKGKKKQKRHRKE